MAILRPEEKNKKNSPEEIIPRNIARLGPSLFLKGELSGEEDVIIEGQYKGKIDLTNHNILVGNGARVKGDIRVKNITIKGSVEGNIEASGKIFILKDGQKYKSSIFKACKDEEKARHFLWLKES